MIYFLSLSSIKLINSLFVVFFGGIFMKLTLAEPKIFIDSIGVIAELVNEVRFKVSGDHIELIAMDPANVAMIIFNLFSSAFTEFKVDQPVELAVSLDSLRAILRRARPSDVITLSLDGDKNRLKIQLKSDTTKTFHLALIRLEDREQRVPQLTFPLKVELPSAVFDDAIQDMDVIAESVALVVDKDKFSVEAESNLNEARTEILNDRETIITSSLKEQVSAKYSIEYLKKLIKGSKLSNRVQLQFNKDYPLRVDYLVKDKVSLSMILAPRVSND